MTTAALSVARANGKTALTAGIAAATLDGPLVVPRGETVIVAGTVEALNFPGPKSSVLDRPGQITVRKG